MKKQVDVVMLPTEKVASLVIRHDKPCVVMLSTDSPFAKKETHTYQHLYFLSDDEIKEGDWVYSNLLGVFQWENDFDTDINDKKIIATTDESLKIETDYSNSKRVIVVESLPRPSNEFLKKFCELGGIDKVLVEYEEDYQTFKGQKLKTVFKEITKGRNTFSAFGLDNVKLATNEPIEQLEFNYRLKVTPDNTITIYPI